MEVPVSLDDDDLAVGALCIVGKLAKDGISFQKMRQ
jgi:hypothetical protein